MEYSLDIQRTLLKFNESVLPDDRINFIKNAISIADAHQDKQWGFDLRLTLIDEESYTPRSVESIPAFAWIIDVYDNDPDLFDVENILSRYRWIINHTFRNAAIPLAEIKKIFADYRKRLKKHGYTLRSYYSAKIDFAFFMNKTESVEKYMDLLYQETSNPFDYWINEHYNKIQLALKQNCFDFAEQLEREINDDDLRYPYYPLGIYTTFLVYYTLHNFKKSEDYFLKAEECLSRIGNDQSSIICVAKMIWYLTQTDEEGALYYFENYVNWSINCDDYTATFFSIYVLNLFKEKRELTLQVSPQIPWYREDNTYNTAELYSYYYNLASGLAERFDRRNDNEVFTHHLKKITDIKKKKGIIAKVWKWISAQFGK